MTQNHTPLERQLEGPRRDMTDSLMIAARMTADIDVLVAAHGYVTLADMISLGWTPAQVEAWSFRPHPIAGQQGLCRDAFVALANRDEG